MSKGGKWKAARARAKAGLTVVPVSISEAAVAEALIASGLPPADTLDRIKVRAALERVIDEWAQSKVARKYSATSCA